MRVGTALVLVIESAALVACGGNVVFVDETAETPPDPPPGPLCQSARDAIDWSACADLSYDPWVPSTRYCENQSSVPACRAQAEAYYGCIAANGAVCVPSVDPELGSESATYDVVACHGPLADFSDCLAACGAASVCPDTVDVCECAAPSYLEGTACCWYPSCPADGSVPSCYAICGNCGGVD